MAGPCICYSLRRNAPPKGEDKLAGGLLGALTKGSNTSTSSPAVSRAPTPIPSSTPLSINELFQQFMKAYLESNQGPSQPPEERKRPFKAKVPDVYYGKLHMDCYHFYQQYEDHFEISWATMTKRTPFVASFLCRNISIRWTQFKCGQGGEVASIIWVEFKAFL